MKRPILLSIVALVLAVILSYVFGFFYISVSPHNTYRLKEKELRLLNVALINYRERIESNRFDEVRDDLSRGRRDAYSEKIILSHIHENLTEFGMPSSWELFRSAQPQRNLDTNETVYHLDYLTTFTNGEVYESFIWLVTAEDEVHLVNTDLHLPDATEWRIEARDKQRAIISTYANEITIPYADRYIEIRY